MQQQQLRKSFWKDLGSSCDLAAGKEEFWGGLCWSCEAVEDDRQFLLGFEQHVCKTISLEGFGENWHTQKVPGSHKDLSARKESIENSWGTDLSTNEFF